MYHIISYHTISVNYVVIEEQCLNNTGKFLLFCWLLIFVQLEGGALGATFRLLY